MERYAFAARIKNGRKEEFHALLKKEEEAIAALLKEGRITNVSLWEIGDFVFLYGEREDTSPATEYSSGLDVLKQRFDPFLSWICPPGQRMRLMYEDFGVVRKDKSHIRHRVFMTKLKPGCAEEYKRRHDVLVSSRNGIPDQGPDSNFSIWSDGEYVFGYDEIDFTMEHPETPEEHEKTVAWETQQLEIMDWISDDMDWLTGEHHEKVRLVASCPGRQS